MNRIPANIREKAEQLAATPDELLPVFSPVERAIIQAVKSLTTSEIITNGGKRDDG